MKFRNYILVFLFTMLSKGIMAQVSNPPECCDFPGWQYYRPIILTNTESTPVVAGTPFVFYMATDALIAAGKMQPNGNDIRILDGFCGNNIGYCIESGINTPNSEIWINLGVIPPNGIATIYIYYGNPTAPAASSCGGFFATSLTISANQTLGGNQAFDKITVNAGVTVTLNPLSPLTFTGKKINIMGTIDGNFKGYAPGTGYVSALPIPVSGAGEDGFGTIGGGGGGHGGNNAANQSGGRGGLPSNGGDAYGTTNGPDNEMGSGGGGSDCPPSASGGGAFSAYGLVIDMNGTITMNGQNATGCAPLIGEAEGGGAGGGVLLQADYINGTGTINCKGGSGGNSTNMEAGGGGGGGIVKRFYLGSNGAGIGIDVSGGAPGVGGIAGATAGATGYNSQIIDQGVTYVIGPTDKSVTPIPTADFTIPGGLCENSAVNFQDASTVSLGTIQNWNWNFGTLSATPNQLVVANPTATATNCGNISVTLTAQTDGGCEAMVTKSLNVTGKPSISFTPAPTCQGLAMSFTENITFSLGCTDTYSVDYDFGDLSPIQTGSNPTHTYAGAGIGPYTVSATVTTAAGCTDVATQQVSYLPNPTVVMNLSSNSECVGRNVSFIDVTNAASRLWDFGDSNTSTVTPDIHVYSSAGIYTVTLTDLSSAGCTSSSTQQITINPLPVPAFTSDVACLGGITSFTDNSQPAGGLTYSWNMPSPAANYNTQNPQHLFNSTNGGQPFNVTLTVSDPITTCTAITTQPVSVVPLPVANFTFPVVNCDPNDVVFTNTSTPNGTFSSVGDFGDGSPMATDTNPIHNFPGPGLYSVTLDILAGSCTANISHNVIVHTKPAANFNVTGTTQCQGTPLTFNDFSTSMDPTEPVTQWLWDLGEVSGIQAANPTTVYNNSNPDPGYTITLIAKTNTCADTISGLLPIYPIPVAVFSALDVCFGYPMVFHNNSTLSYGTIAQYVFDYGDNSATVSLVDSLTYTYLAPSTYASVLTLTSDQNCVATTTVPVTVNPLPVPEFFADRPEGCDYPYDVAFTDNSTPLSPPHQVVDWQWNFGNSTFNGEFPNPVTYTTGTYDVNLVVTTIDGCVDSVRQPGVVIVHPLPIAKFVCDPEVAEILSPSVNFINQSEGWQYCTIDLGDGNVEGISDLLQHIYNDTGLYKITLKAITEFGCEDTVTRYASVIPEFVWFTPNAFTPNHDLKNEEWGGKGMDLKKYELLIYNRWGQEVFRSKDPEEKWDGTYRIFGQEQEKIIKQDIYVYKINILDNNDQRHIYTGRLYVYPDTEKKLKY